MKRLLVLIIALIATISMTTESYARKRYKHHRHHRYHHGYHHKLLYLADTLPVESVPHSSRTGLAMLAEAKRWIGSGNPTGFRGPWCGAFQAMVAKNVGVQPPTGYLMAKSWVNAGTRLRGPAIGAIAVLGRRHGGHVGIVSGLRSDGNPVIVSGNHNRRVGVGVYSHSNVLAYVEP